MAERIMELEKQITEKNIMLSSLNKDDKEDREKIYILKRELDKLLYIYYKSLRSKLGSAFWCSAAL